MYCDQAEVGIFAHFDLLFWGYCTSCGDQFIFSGKFIYHYASLIINIKRNYIINPSGTALVLGAVVKIVSLLRNRVPFYCFKRFRSES